MARTRHSRIETVERFDDVPVFESEAEESTFWATHRLGDGLLARMGPLPDGTLPPARGQIVAEAIGMHMKLLQWLGREFVALSGEGRAGATAKEETHDLLLRFDEALRDLGLSLDNTVRTRLWARDRHSRDQGSEARLELLSGKARSASSSYIAPSHFDSQARVALDLLALRPSRPGLAKTVVEYDPPIVPVRYIIYDSVVFLSGVTAVLPTLAYQVADILSHLRASLADAGTSWEQVVQVSCFLHRSQKLATLEELLQQAIRAEIPRLDYAFVDGYSAEGKLIEIEVTATL